MNVYERLRKWEYLKVYFFLYQGYVKLKKGIVDKYFYRVKKIMKAPNCFENSHAQFLFQKKINFHVYPHANIRD